MIKNVCVFASSSNKLNKIYYKDAAELGAMLGAKGINVVYGGGRLGVMYACASSVKDNGGKLSGVMPQKFCDLGVANPSDCVEFHKTSGTRARNAKLDELSDAVIALAGGFGTLEEISEMIVQKQLGYNKKPIVLLNTNGFYNKLIEFFNTIISENFAPEASKELYYVASTPKEVVDYLV